MLFCTDCTLVTWTPDFSLSGQKNPVWTKVACHKSTLCNSLEWIDWSDNPVQVILCEACGSSGCASGNYVNISRLDNSLLWTMPHIDPFDDEWVGVQYAPSYILEKWGSVVIPFAEWSNWRIQVKSLPDAGLFPQTTLRDLGDAWWMEACDATRAKSLENVADHLKDILLASDNLSVDEAIMEIRRLVDWFRKSSSQVATGTLRRASEIGAVPERFYFDGPAFEDWTALARFGDTYIPAFGNEWVYTA